MKTVDSDPAANVSVLFVPSTVVNGQYKLFYIKNMLAAKNKLQNIDII